MKESHVLYYLHNEYVTGESEKATIVSAGPANSSVDPIKDQVGRVLVIFFGEQTHASDDANNFSS
jgi:hypothetical protein